MRNCKNVMAKELFKARLGSKGKVEASKADQTAKNWEAIRDQIEADSLLARSCEESINDTDTIKSHTDFESKHRSSEEVVRRNHMERNSLLFRRGERSHDTISFQRPDRMRPLSYSGENFIAPSVSGGIFDNELIRSCEQGDSLQVQWLAVRGVDLQAQFKEGSYSGLTAVHVAAINGHIDVVKVLLSCGANIEGKTASERRRPLHLAALNGRVSMVQFLIREGAQIDAKAQYRMQPIHDVSWSGSVEILDALTEAGARVDCLDMFGHQPLHWAAVTPNQSHFIQYLISKGADIEAKALNGSTPVRLACRSDPTNFRTLIELGAMTEYDDGSEPVLDTAIKCDSKWALKILRSNGANPNRQNL